MRIAAACSWCIQKMATNNIVFFGLLAIPVFGMSMYSQTQLNSGRNQSRSTLDPPHRWFRNFKELGNLKESPPATPKASFPISRKSARTDSIVLNAQIEKHLFCRFSFFATALLPIPEEKSRKISSTIFARQGIATIFSFLISSQAGRIAVRWFLISLLAFTCPRCFEPLGLHYAFFVGSLHCNQR